MRKIILASSSKHRKKLLNQLKIKFTTKSPDIDESRRKNENVDEFVKNIKKVVNDPEKSLGRYINQQIKDKAITIKDI